MVRPCAKYARLNCEHRQTNRRKTSAGFLSACSPARCAVFFWGSVQRQAGKEQFDCRFVHIRVARSNFCSVRHRGFAAAFTQGHRLAGGSRPQRVLTFSVPCSLWGADCLLKIFAASLSGNRAACRAEQIHSIAVAAYGSGCDCERGGDKAAYEIVRFEEGQARHREQQQRACGEAV